MCTFCFRRTVLIILREVIEMAGHLAKVKFILLCELIGLMRDVKLLFCDIYFAGWSPKKSTMRTMKPTSITHPTFPLLNTNEIMSRRIDQLLPNAEDIVKEHAKLVQDINSLRHVVFVSPFADDNRDYDESVLQEIIEISSTPRPPLKVTSSRPPPPKPTKASSIPIILLGGASQPEIVRAQPMKFSKPISLVGSSVSPLVKHPYPFVVQGTSQRPFKFCMNPMHAMMYSTTPRPNLFQRLFSSIFPRGLGR